MPKPGAAKPKHNLNVLMQQKTALGSVASMFTSHKGRAAQALMVNPARPSCANDKGRWGVFFTSPGGSWTG